MHQPSVNQGYSARERSYKDVRRGVHTNMPVDSFGLCLKHDAGKLRAFIVCTREVWVDDGEATRTVDHVAMKEITFGAYEYLHEQMESLQNIFRKIEGGTYEVRYS